MYNNRRVMPIGENRDFIISDHARKRAQSRFGKRVAESLATFLMDSEEIEEGIYACGEMVFVTAPGKGKAKGKTVVVTVRPIHVSERER